MKLIFITNFYPPYNRGGYEEWCQEVAEGLRDRGHDITVLTSQYCKSRITSSEPSWIYRTLFLEMELGALRNSVQFFTTRKSHEKMNLDTLREIISKNNPDGILIWGMWNLSRSIPVLAERLVPGRVVYYLGDYWPLLPNQLETYWQVPAQIWATSIPKQIIKPFALKVLAQEKREKWQFSNVIFPSEFLRDEYARNGLTWENSTIIYGGAKTHLYSSYQHERKTSDSSISLLYVGRLAEEKGVETCIQALSVLNEIVNGTVNLQIVGSGERNYESFLIELTKKHQVADQVFFFGRKPKMDLPIIYHDADIFIFPSIWPEPFGRVLVEAMASGLPVVGTTVGGAGEILKDGQNGLAFPPGDPGGLATQVARLIGSPQLRQELAEAGRKTALEKFDIQRMVSELEKYMQSLIVN